MFKTEKEEKQKKRSPQDRNLSHRHFRWQSEQANHSILLKCHQIKIMAKYWDRGKLCPLLCGCGRPAFKDPARSVISVGRRGGRREDTFHVSGLRNVVLEKIGSCELHCISWFGTWHQCNTSAGYYRPREKLFPSFVPICSTSNSCWEGIFPMVFFWKVYKIFSIMPCC